MAANSLAPRFQPPVVRFVHNGRSYVLETAEGDATRRVLSRSHSEIESMFLRKLVPQAERRAIAAESLTLPTSEALPEELRWVRWHRPEESPAPIWGLFLRSEPALNPEESLDEDNSPANDTLTLLAWGDGPVMAWARATPEAHALIVRALRTLPPWLMDGVVSVDPFFKTSVRPAPALPARETSVRSAAVSNSQRKTANEQPEVSQRARSVLSAWRRANPARSA
ncbi:MAG: hypothetical protein Q8Q09_08810 [Deltaproteobacteria bacterium]|nr:hypothetical protein [Deltaproteobacteria bacterium]